MKKSLDVMAAAGVLNVRIKKTNKHDCQLASRPVGVTYPFARSRGPGAANPAESTCGSSLTWLEPGPATASSLGSLNLHPFEDHDMIATSISPDTTTPGIGSQAAISDDVLEGLAEGIAQLVRQGFDAELIVDESTGPPTPWVARKPSSLPSVPGGYQSDDDRGDGCDEA